MNSILLAASILALPPGSIERDPYGVPKIVAPTPEDGFYWAG